MFPHQIIIETQNWISPLLVSNIVVDLLQLF